MLQVTVMGHMSCMDCGGLGRLSKNRLWVPVGAMGCDGSGMM